MPKKKEKTKRKGKTKEVIALTLALIAIAFFLINAIFLLISSEKIIAKIVETGALTEAEGIDVLNMLPSMLTVLAVVWFVMAGIMSVTVYFVEKGKWQWYVLLIISIVSIFTGRLEAAALGIIASFLYKK